MTCLAVWLLHAAPAAAQDASSELSPSRAAPFQQDLGHYYYQHLRRSPGKAFLWDLALPGAGNVYTRLYGNAIVTGVLTLVGAGLWIAGAAADHDRLWWAGMGVFAGGRTYGLVSAPAGAALLNAAFRRQFGLSRR